MSNRETYIQDTLRKLPWPNRQATPVGINIDTYITDMTLDMT